MASVDESLSGASPLNAALRPGVGTIGAQQTVTFKKYVRVVLPADGFVFWVRADILTPAMLGLAINPATPDSPLSITAQGSLHYASDSKQEEDSTYAVNRVVFTSEVEIQDLSAVSPTTIYIGEFEGVRFAFNQRASFYAQAGLYHYVGQALYSVMETQVIDDPADLDLASAVVSSSLPIWLNLNTYAPAYPVPLAMPKFTLYPSFAVPDNLAPPYGAVHILPESTRGLQGAASFDSAMSSTQLSTERVRVTLYGVRNDDAITFLNVVNQYSLDTDYMGMMNIPVVRDERKIQSELSILAMKKSIEFEINYNQFAMRSLSHQLIESAFISFVIQD